MKGYAIAHLRTPTGNDEVEVETIIVEGVRDWHDPAKMVAVMRAAANG